MKFRRALKWTGIGTGVALLALAASGAWYTNAVQPKISGALKVAGLSAPADVVRDKDGVPHIYAASENDALFVQGFVHAQDRLWQMEMHRRIANGRMAEILGVKALDADLMLRTLGVRRAAEAMWARYTPAERVQFEVYAKGVNAFLAQRSGPLPPEFLMTGAPAPEPWTPVDSIGWTIMMAWDLGGNWRSELLRLNLAQHGLDLKQIHEFLPAYPGDTYPALANAPTLYKELRAEAAQAHKTLAALPGYVEGMGSNNWVVSGARSETGKPLLANDPHLGLSAPALWYFAHLAAPDGLNVIGASLPGVPGIVLGRNSRIAWGFTNTAPDVQDLFIEKINPQNPNQYKTPDGWADFETVEERIKIKGEADRVLRVRISRHGPVVSDGAAAVLKAAAPTGHAIAFAWTALLPENRTPLAARGIARAKNWDEFLVAARDFHAPQQNIVYADVDGNIGYIAPGMVPIRKPENDLKGLFPALGWEAKYDWAGFIPFDALPRQYNPAAGFRATANEKIVGPDYPHHITYEWAPPYRADRIAELLAAKPKHSLDSFAAIQADVVSLSIRQALPHLLAAPTAGAKEKSARDLLAKWDATMSAERPEPLIATAWMRELARLIYADEIGVELMRGTFDQRSQFVIAVLEGKDGMGRWCNVVGATATVPKACPNLITEALGLAVADLEKRNGADMSAWRWGAAHNARSSHRPFAGVPALAKYFDVREPVSGDTYTVNVSRHDIRNETEPYTAVHAASLRALYDLADLENSRFIHSTGQSGIVFSQLYANLAKRWASVQYIPMKTVRTSVEPGALGVLRLSP